MDPESQPEQPRSTGPTAATESTPLLPRPDSDPDASPPPPIPHWVIASHWITAIDGLIVAALCFAIIVIDAFYRPRIYSMPWGIYHGLSPNILGGFISTTWAISSLVRIRRLGVSMPVLVAALMHALLGVWLLVAFTDGAVGLLRDQTWCYDWGRPQDPIKQHECFEWAAKFSIFLWVYLVLVLVLGVVHVALLVFTCAGPFRGIGWRESLGSWRFPTGQLTVEFTIKFLRQDHNLPPVPAQPVASAAETP